MFSNFSFAKNHRIANTFTILVREKISADLESLEFLKNYVHFKMISLTYRLCHQISNFTIYLNCCGLNRTAGIRYAGKQQS